MFGFFEWDFLAFNWSPPALIDSTFPATTHRESVGIDGQKPEQKPSGYG